VARLRIFHFNDLHGRLAGLDEQEGAPIFSRIARHVAAARASCAEKPDEAVLFFSGGDDLIGSPIAALMGTRPEEFRCHAAYRLYSAAGVDAGAIGNHDLDWGLALLSLAAERDAVFPLVSANIVTAQPYAGIVPTATISAKGLRVGIIGVTTPAEIKGPTPGEFVVADPVAAVAEHAAAMRPRCDVLIVLSHLGYSLDHPAGIVTAAGDVELARALPPGSVDLILGAHTHFALNANGLEPANLVNGIAIAQAGAFGRYLGEVTLEIDADGARVTGARLLAVEGLPADPAFDEAHARPLLAQTQALMREPLGDAEPHPDLDSAEARAAFSGRENALVNFVADALAARCRRAGIPVDFALVDASVVSAGLPAGQLTLGDAHRLSPFADSIVTFTLPRGRLQALLDDNARRAASADAAPEGRGFAHFSREVRYVIAGGPGDATVRAEDVTLRGERLDDLTDGGTLLIACGSFTRVPARAWERATTAAGGTLFDIAALPRQQTGLPLRAELVAHIRETGGVTGPTGLLRDGRLRRRDYGGAGEGPAQGEGT
jgi:5'-nucleotidase / UDP-sugar diphosphatase